MADWWNPLSLELKTFYTIGAASTSALLVQVLLMAFGGGDGDIDAGDAAGMDGDVGMEHPGDLNVLSVRTVVAFFAGFGWTGVICLKEGLPLGIVLLISTIVGIAFMMGVFYLMKFLYGLRDSGNINYENAVGKIGSVYMPIPPNQSGEGQIEIMIQGRVRFVPAFTKSNQRLAGSRRIRVVGTIDSRTLLVEPLDAPEASQERTES